MTKRSIPCALCGTPVEVSEKGEMILVLLCNTCVDEHQNKNLSLSYNIKRTKKRSESMSVSKSQDITMTLWKLARSGDNGR